MGTMIFIHSFRGGTGKTNIAANLASCLASQDKTTCLFDLDVQSPGIHAIFGFSTDLPCKSLNEFLWQKCSIKECVTDIGNTRGLGPGRLYLVPASIEVNDIIRILKEGYDFSLLSKGLHELMNSLDLDYLIVDTHPGVYEETLFAIAIADVLLTVIRPDVQDYQGTAVIQELSKKLGVSTMYLVANKIPDSGQVQSVKEDMERRYNCEVIGTIVHSPEVLSLGSKEPLYMKNPSSGFSSSISQLAERIIARRQ